MNNEKIHRDITNENISNFSKYRLLYLGNMGLWKILQFEFVTTLFCNTPGALGLLLRKVFYRGIFRKVGKNVIFGRGITIRHPAKITIGNNVIIEYNCVLDAKGGSNSRILIKDSVIISRNVVLSCKNGLIEIGNNTVIGINCTIHSVGISKVLIGNDVLISAYVYLIGGGTYHFKSPDKVIREQGLDLKGGITIEDNVWLGASVNVVDGVRISNGSIVGACSLVARNIEKEDSISIGIPARFVKKRF